MARTNPSHVRRIVALAAAHTANPSKPVKPMRATVLAALRMPDGSKLSADLAAWLAFDASWLPLHRGKAKPEWALAEGEALRSYLPTLGLPADVPLVELEPAASEKHYLALFPMRGNPVLAWDGTELWVAAESLADYLEAVFPVPRPAPASPPRATGSSKSVAIKSMSPQEVEALPLETLTTIATGLGETRNAKRLADTALVEALFLALKGHGACAEALFVAQCQAAARADRSISLGLLVPVLELATAWKEPAAARWALDAYRRAAKRDPNNLYSLGSAHALALECADVVGERMRMLEVIENVLLFIGGVPDSVPVAAPALADLWARPTMACFSDRVAALAAKQADTPQTRRKAR